MANTDLHTDTITDVQVKDNEKFYAVRLFGTDRTYPSGGTTVSYPTTGQTYPLGIPEDN